MLTTQEEQNSNISTTTELSKNVFSITKDRARTTSLNSIRTGITVEPALDAITVYRNVSNIGNRTTKRLKLGKSKKSNKKNFASTIRIKADGLFDSQEVSFKNINILLSQEIKDFFDSMNCFDITRLNSAQLLERI